MGLKCRQGRDQPVEIRFGPSEIRLAEENERRPVCRLKGQYGGKVGIGRHENSMFFSRPREYDLVTRGRETALADVHRIAAGSAQKRCEPRGSALSIRNFKRNAEPGPRAPEPSQRRSGGTHEYHRIGGPDTRPGSRARTNRLPASSVRWLLECVNRGGKGRRPSGVDPP